MSRSPVREAFRILERDGLITTLPRKGSYITDISLKDLEELFEVRKILECYALDCIKKRAKKSPDEITSMIEELDKNLLKKHDPFSVISSFHYSLVELSNNSRLIELYKILSVSLRRYWLIYHSKNELFIKLNSEKMRKKKHFIGLVFKKIHSMPFEVIIWGIAI
jgi:DNA-binding GntR family transcriptional regulator